MELHALHHQGSVANAHDLTLRRARRHFELRRQALRRSNQGMITTHLTGLRRPANRPRPSCSTIDVLAMHEAAGAHDLAAKDLDYGLVAQTHSEHRDRAGEGPNHVIETPAS